MLEDIISERKRKLNELTQARVNPYPSRTGRTILIRDLLEDFAKLLKAGKPLTASGRVLRLRDQGNLIFADIKDESGKAQIILKKDNLPNFKLLKGALDIGDFLEVAGVPLKTKSGEKSVEAKTARFLAKSLRPLPSEWYGLKDAEERFRKRYLDLILNPEAKARLMTRSDVIRSLREFLYAEGFLEVETPVLQTLPGGAKAKPFQTHHNALDQDFYLRIAPELFLKRLLIGGFEKVFELGKVFRNEGIDRDHNPEFTMLELYLAYEDWKGLMKFTQKMLKKFLPGKWETTTYGDAFKKFAKKDIKSVPAGEIDETFKKEVRPKIVRPTFVTHYPKSISPLAKSSEGNPELTERFQLIVGGSEIVNGFSELNDPIDQRARMELQEKEFRAGNEEASRMDEDFLEALEYGMPPAAGLGLGVDRLVALVTESHNVKEIIAFPTLRDK